MLLDIYAGVDGTTVRIQLSDTSERDQLARNLNSLANRVIHELNLQNEGVHQSAIRIRLAVVAVRAQERLTISDGSNVSWLRTLEGWREAAELVQTLEVGTSQLLSQHSTDSAVIELCL